MSSRTPIHLLLALFIQLLLQPSLIHSATIPQSSGITATNATVNAEPAQCIDNEGWVGDGIIVSDCIEAIHEFYRTQVQPRREQHYEFTQIGVTRTTGLPYVNTPRKFDHGTCVIALGMLDTYWPGAITDIKPLYTRTDIATFNEIANTAASVYSKCVKVKRKPVAGWIATGLHDSIGVFILRKGSVVDRIMLGSEPTSTSINNGTSSIGLIELPETSDGVVTAQG